MADPTVDGGACAVGGAASAGSFVAAAPAASLSAASLVPLAPADVSLCGAPVTLCKAGDRFFMWDGAEVARLRFFGRMAVTAVGSCPTKSSTRGKAAALPVLLSDEEAAALVGAGWARVVDATGAHVDAPALLAAAVAGDPAGTRAQRRLVWRDLWARGYSLTNGIKFGCDFLCYRADPTAVHAAFMVVVLKEGAGVRPLSLTAVARVATTALKIAVVAWADAAAGTVRYAAFKRMGPGSAIFADSTARLEHVAGVVDDYAAAPPPSAPGAADADGAAAGGGGGGGGPAASIAPAGAAVLANGAPA